jgi:hypothetical protein
MNFLSDIVKPRKTAANNITLQIREDVAHQTIITLHLSLTPIVNIQNNTHLLSRPKKIVGQYVTVDTYSIWKCLQ